jgi:CBS domain-containing protein
MNTQIRDLLTNVNLITCAENESVADALDKLKSNDIISMPILSNDNKMLGFVDVLDLVAFLYNVSTRLMTTTDFGESRKLSTDDVRILGRRAKDFRLSQVRDVIDFSKRNPFHSLNEDAPLSNAIELFKNRIHRIAVMSAGKDQIVGVLTQLDVLKWLSDNSSNESINNFMKTCKDLKPSDKNNILQSREFVQVKWNESTIDGFLRMHDAGISAVAIVKDNNEVCGILSATDLKGLHDDFSILLKPVGEYVENIRKNQSKSADYLVTCPMDCSLSEALDIVNREKVHRVLVVDNQKKPAGVITLTDMFNLIFQQRQGQTTVSK